MVKNISILFLCLFLFSCKGQNKEIIKEEVIENLKEYKKPIFNLKIQAASPYEVSINDILVDYHYDTGTIDYDIDINQWILNSGTVKLNAKIFPTTENPRSNVVKKTISEYFKLSLYVYEKEDKTQTKQLLQEFKFTPQKEELPTIQESWKMDLKVPYELNGWRNSENLSKMDKDSLKSEVIEIYHKIAKAINEGNINQYNTLFKKADDEFYQSMYYNANEINESKKDITTIIKEAENKTVFSDDYELHFYANGKIVTLENKKKESPLYADLGESIQHFSIFLHRPSPTSDLEIIR